MKHKKYLIFIIAVWAFLVFPFAGMLFWRSDETTENTELASFPSLKTEEGWNQEYLSEMGAYFEDHFALRQYWVTANALLRKNVIQSSATDQVVLGKNDWLYFSGTTADYQGTNLFSEREMNAILHNLKLIQNYVQQQGSAFYLMVPPNKNSLYDENMPYYYQKGDGSNLKMLTERFQQEGISYIDLYGAFQEKEEVLYFQRDSHWNNQGALLAYRNLMEQVGKDYETYLNVPFDVEKVHSGDLDEMLFPKAMQKEDDYFYDTASNFVYVNEVKDNMDSWIETENPDATGSILMYRDSFGESLLPFVAGEFERGYFSRLVPYNLLQVEQYQPDVVVIEKVERNLDDFITDMPIVECPQVKNMIAPQAQTNTEMTAEKAGSFLEIKGTLDEKYVQPDTQIYVSVRDENTMETKTYETFYAETEDGEANGFHLYLKGSSVPEGNIQLNVIAVNGSQPFIVCSKEITWNL